MGHLGARVFGDGSCIVLGGQAGAADRELARAGWGFVQLEDDGVTISASAYGPVPGRIQDNDVAELLCFPHGFTARRPRRIGIFHR